MKSPSFRFYPSDYLSSQRVQMLSLEEEGIYIRLLCFCWQHGSIPANPELCLKLLGKVSSSTLVSNVLSMFSPHPQNIEKLIHDRLEFEREKQRVWVEKCSKGGKKSALIRYTLKTKTNSKGTSTNLKRLVQPARVEAAQVEHSDSVFIDNISNDILSLPPNQNLADRGGEKDQKKTRKRDPLFDALARACGSDPFQMTARAMRACGVALAEIRKATPSIKEDDFFPRVRRYRLIYPTAALTPSALCAHWAECSPTAPSLNADQKVKWATA